MADKSENTFGETVSGYRDEFQKILDKVPMAVRVLIIGIAVIAIGIGVSLALIDRTEETVLFTNLSTEDAASIVEQLKSQNVTYRISGAGGTIYVPSQQVHDLRLSLANEGLPVGGGVGFELFDEQRFGMTEFEERMALRRALEGEMSRTITRLDVIKAARVHLVLPKRSLLGATQTPAQGSVVVEMQRGRDLAQGTVRSIIHLVSSAVEGLNPDEVTVVDTRGRMLSSESGYGFSSREVDYKRKYEGDLEHRLKEMLDQILGPDSSVVRIAASFDFSQQESTLESYDPERSVLRSEKRESEIVGAGATQEGGVPGAATNLPGGAAPVSRTTESNKKRESETRNYEVEKLVKHVVKPVALLKNLSVSVLVDGTYETPLGEAIVEGEEGTEDPAKAVYSPRTNEEMKKIEAAVRGAIGYSGSRGDTVVVQSVQFHIPEEIESPDYIGAPWWIEYVPMGAGGIAGIVLLLWVMLARRKKVPQEKPVPVDALALPRAVKELEAMMEEQEAGSVESEATAAKNAELAALAQIPEPSIEAQSVAQLMGEVRNLFMEESEMAARVLQNWLSEDRFANGEENVAVPVKGNEKEAPKRAEA